VTPALHGNNPSALAIPREFYLRHSSEVARGLLGARLVRLVNGQRLAGIIVEAEGYEGEEDLACHAHHGRTRRTAVMYGPPGHAYVYFTYGMHWMLNAVCGAEGHPAAALLRAIFPTEGVETIAARRAGRPPSQWCNGPGKLTQALSIDRVLNGHDLCCPQEALWIEEGMPIPDFQVIKGPRVGLGKTPEPWLSKPWRFQVASSSVF
jgi:DNA-3-methyladenine glycosylase